MKIYVVKTEDELRSAFLDADIIIWSGEGSFADVLDKLSDVSNDLKIRVRLAKNISFKSPVTLVYKNISLSCKDFADILEKVNEHAPSLFESALSGCTLIVNSNSTNEVLEIMQQMANLRFLPDTVTINELSTRRLLENFRKNYDELLKAVEKTHEKINNYICVFGDTIKEKEYLLKNIKLIKSIMIDVKNKKINISVFGTKKSGKSMVLNCLLEEEYAPTSQELPTPTVISYIPNKDNNIKLVYDSKELTFKDAKSVRKELLRMFEAVNKTGKKLPEIKIFYPSKNKDYIIQDTPGPDLAGSEHRDFIDTSIKNSDVAVFIIDYSKHAQNDEINLLNKVLEKFYKRKSSLIILVNKTDLMFQDEGLGKITTRVTEFIREKFAELEKKSTLKDASFLFIPTSALMYFDSLRIEEKFPEVVQNLEEIESIDDDDYTTHLHNMDKYKSFLKRHYKIKNPSLNHVKFLSNFSVFEKYLDYVSTKKVYLEEFSDKYNEMSNALSACLNRVELLRLLKREHFKIRDTLDKYLRDSKERIQKLEKSIEQRMSEFQREVKIILSEEIEHYTNSLKDYIKELFQYEELKSLVNDLIQKAVLESSKKQEYEENMSNTLLSIRHILNDLAEKAINDVLDSESVFSELSDEFYQKLNEFSAEIKNYFDKTKRDLDNSLKDVVNVIKSTFDMDMSLEVPQFDFYVDVSDLKDYIEELREAMLDRRNNLKLEHIRTTLDQELEKNWFIRFWNSLTGAIDKVKMDVIPQIVEGVQRQIYQSKDDFVNYINNISEELQKKIEKKIENKSFYLRKNLMRNFEQFVEDMQQIDFSVRNMLEADLKVKEELIKFAEDVLNIFTETDGLKVKWDEIFNVGGR